MSRSALLVATALVAPSLALAQEAPSAPSVTWLVEGPDLTIRDGTSFDWFFTYEVALPDDPEGDAVLELTKCLGRGPCETSQLPVVHGTSSIRWGIDPGTYHMGQNRYSFTLRLVDGGEIVEDVLDARITVVR